MARAYGAWGLFGMKRAVFLIDERGIVRYEHVEAISLFRRTREELLAVCRSLDAGRRLRRAQASAWSR
ncbi:MAG: hypothetical protein RML12_06215 [Xanthomonadales bacterium]|nr:hypothetical protein [Xanthomonadales bacterium]